MSYTYLYAIAKPKAKGSRWVERDLSGMTFSEMYDEFRDAKIAIGHPVFESDYYIELDEIRSMITDPDQRLVIWLNRLGSQSLPVEEGKPVLENRTVECRDVWMTGFDVQATRMGSHPETPWTDETMTDLLLTKDGVDYRDAYRRLLVSVDGFIHRTSYSQDGLYVVDGARGRIEANRTQLSLIDFGKVGELQFVDIRPKMLYRPNPDGKHYQYAHLNLGVPTEGKTVMLVIGGYPHLLDNAYKMIGDGLVQIDFNNYPLLQRYYESRQFVDWEHVSFTEVGSMDTQRLVREVLRSEKFIEGLLYSSQTFAVIIDSPDVYVERHQVEKTDLPGIFLAYDQPDWPLESLRGRWLPYWAHKEEDRWVVNCGDNSLPNYVFEHTDYESLYSVTDQKIPTQPHYRDRGFLVEIGRDL